jgi:hypothetical protein
LYEKLVNEIEEDIKAGKYSENQYVDFIKNTATSYIPKLWSLEGEERLNAIDRLVNEGSISMSMADHLRDMSGTAASEAEAKRTFNYMMGGKGVSMDVRLSKLKNFTKRKRDTAIKKAKEIARKGGLVTAYSFLDPDKVQYAKKEKEKKYINVNSYGIKFK